MRVLRTECAGRLQSCSSFRAVATTLLIGLAPPASGIFRAPFTLPSDYFLPRRRILVELAAWRERGGMLIAENRGSHSAMDRQLYDSVFYCRVRLPVALLFIHLLRRQARSYPNRQGLIEILTSSMRLDGK